MSSSSSASNTARKLYATVLNVIAPGAGLIILRREWLGLAIALLFTVVAQLALWGLLIVPAVIPRWLSFALLVVAVVVWLVAQWLGIARARDVLSEEAADGLRLLSERAQTAIEQQRFAEARDLLLLALTINDEDLDVHCQWARLMTLMGQFPQARKAWERVLRLGVSHDRRREAIDALERIPQ